MTVTPIYVVLFLDGKWWALRKKGRLPIFIREKAFDKRIEAIDYADRHGILLSG